MGNDFVGMYCCMYCNEIQGITIHKHLKKVPQYGYLSPEPCDKCKEQFKAEGKVPLHEMTFDRKGNAILTGKRVFVKREAIQGKQFIEMMNNNGFLFCDEEFFNKLMKDIRKEQKYVECKI